MYNCLFLLAFALWKSEDIHVMDPILLIIAGPTASGKSHLVEHLFKQLQPYIAVICADNYYHAYDEIAFEDRFNQNFDHPDAVEWSLIEKHIIELKAGKAVQTPKYCFKQQTRLSASTYVAPKPIILLDGILSLAMPEIRKHANLSIFLDTPLDICLHRKMSRDINERARTPDRILKQYLRFTRPMYQKFILPSRQYADIILPTSESVDKLCVLLKQYLVTYKHQDEEVTDG